jgi:hypothetical protein
MSWTMQSPTAATTSQTSAMRTGMSILLIFESHAPKRWTLRWCSSSNTRFTRTLHTPRRAFHCFHGHGYNRGEKSGNGTRHRRPHSQRLQHLERGEHDDTGGHVGNSSRENKCSRRQWRSLEFVCQIAQRLRVWVLGSQCVDDADAGVCGSEPSQWVPEEVPKRARQRHRQRPRRASGSARC